MFLFILLEVFVWKQLHITEPNCSWGFCSQHLYGSGWCAPVNLGCSCTFSSNVGKWPADFGCACSTHVSSGRPWIWRSFHIQHKHKSVEPDFHLRLSILWCKNPDRQVDDPHSLLQECHLKMMWSQWKKDDWVNHLFRKVFTSSMLS